MKAKFIKVVCAACKGLGHLKKKDCPKCLGRGYSFEKDNTWIKL
jgi:DnaJ-class molecular chaperone